MENSSHRAADSGKENGRQAGAEGTSLEVHEPNETDVLRHFDRLIPQGLGSENRRWRALQSASVDDRDCPSELSVFRANMDKPLALSVIPLKKR